MLHLPQARSPLPVMNFHAETLSAWPEPDRAPRNQTSESFISHDRARILSIGDDPVLLYSRRLVLEKDGYFVATLRSDALLDEEQLRGFDLILLCHSIPDNVAARILEVLWRVTPQTPVVLVSRLDVCASGGPHHVAVSAFPAALLDVVAKQIAAHKNSGLRSQS